MAAPRPAAAAAAAWPLLLCWAPRCRGLYDPVRRIESARVYGNIHEYAYYYIDLVVGTPRQRVSVILDTGSSIVAFPCAGCTHCGQHIDPAFDLARSSTAQWTLCGDPRCQEGCKEGWCAYWQSYSEGSSVSGFWFEDEVQLGDSIQHNPAVRSQLGCHYLENNLFYHQKVNGIVGIGPQRDTLLRTLFADHAHVEGSIFAICLAEWGGRFVVGGHNDSYHTGPVQYLPLSTARGSYGVPITAISVEGQVVSAELGRAMVDSGTTYTYMADRPYRALRNAIESRCAGGRCGGARQLENGQCWHVPAGLAGLERFPRVDVIFQDVAVRWIAGGYLYRMGAGSTWCYSFQNDGPNADTTLGASWMIQNEVIFDMQADRLGVAPAACPEFRTRPRHPDTGRAAAGGDGWSVEIAVQGFGVRSLRWWEVSLVVLLMGFPVAFLARRCWGCHGVGYSNMGIEDPDIPGTVVGTAAESAMAGGSLAETS